ncbi:MAG: hypothetical protein GC192_02565 [Bacteroidetes bacterium]|nr:hypothetical protein [Bacteroidota bacterium]
MVDDNGNILAKYQLGNAKYGEPALLYTYKEIDGIWETYQLEISMPNKQGDYYFVQDIQVAGYGYISTNYQYDYDECGNWVKKYKQGVSGQYHLISVREITY